MQGFRWLAHANTSLAKCSIKTTYKFVQLVSRQVVDAGRGRASAAGRELPAQRVRTHHLAEWRVDADGVSTPGVGRQYRVCEIGRPIRQLVAEAPCANMT